MKIQLSIQEIIQDFENIIRYDERLQFLKEMNIKEEDEKEFITFLQQLGKKYIPNYKEYMQDTTNTQENIIILNNMLYKNFKEIIYGLI